MVIRIAFIVYFSAPCAFLFKCAVYKYTYLLTYLLTYTVLNLFAGSGADCRNDFA